MEMESSKFAMKSCTGKFEMNLKGIKFFLHVYIYIFTLGKDMEICLTLMIVVPMFCALKTKEV